MNDAAWPRTNTDMKVERANNDGSAPGLAVRCSVALFSLVMELLDPCNKWNGGELHGMKKGAVADVWWWVVVD